MSRYEAEDYGVSIMYSPEDESYVATCPEFPGLTGFGETHAEALEDMHQVLAAALEVHVRKGYPIPEPHRPEEVVLPSGEFRVRIPRRLHYQLAEAARQEGVSLNHLVSNMLQDGVTRRATTALHKMEEPQLTPCSEPADPDHASLLTRNGSSTVTETLPVQDPEKVSLQQWQAQAPVSIEETDVKLQVRAGAN